MTENTNLRIKSSFITIDGLFEEVDIIKNNFNQIIKKIIKSTKENGIDIDVHDLQEIEDAALASIVFELKVMLRLKNKTVNEHCKN